MHTLIQITGMGEADVAPVFDAGVCGKYNRFRIGAALMRINEPELNNGDIVPLRFTAGVACRPAETFVLAADVIRESAIESFGLGIEFKLIPQLTLRSGLGTNPLRYAGGLDATIGPLALNYAYQFHPQLKESHLLELRLAWL
ncbi:MAG: hypothetical protein ABIK44_06260 [candidate division WOR-3 bacterium]